MDTSALVAACGSKRGGARTIIESSQRLEWMLFASPYVLNEFDRNIRKFPEERRTDWLKIRDSLIIVPDIVSAGRITVFDVSKDRPVLFTALGCAQVLLTLDRADFNRLGTSFYSLEIMTPGRFLEEQRSFGCNI